MATLAGDESVRQYVARCLPGVGDAEREAEYQRLRRQRFNAIAKLRVLCAAEPPRRAA